MSRVAEKRRGEEEMKQGGKRESSDKENSQHNSAGAGNPRKKVTGAKTSGGESNKAGEKLKAVVGKTYGKRGQLAMRGSKEEEEENKEGMGKKNVLGQSTISRKPHVVTKQVICCVCPYLLFASYYF